MTALKTLLALAVSGAACTAFAQQASDANAAGVTSAPQPADSALEARPGMNDASSSYRDTARQDFRSACAGLSDRQTERACKETYRTGRDEPNRSLTGNDAGNIEDQAN